MTSPPLVSGGAAVGSVLRRQRLDFAAAYAAMLFGGLVVAFFAARRTWQPYIGLTLAALGLVWLAWALKPRLGLGLTVFLAVVGDTVTISWFPFNKNLSSHESIMFLADGLTLSPLELTLAWGLVVVCFRAMAARRRLLELGSLGPALVLFVGAVGFGLFNGLAAGGDSRAAIFEMRPLLVFPVTYLLAHNVCREPRHYRNLMYGVLAAIVVQSVVSLRSLLQLTPAERDGLESLTEHGSSIGMNLLLLAMIALLVVRGSPTGVRWWLVLGSVPVLYVYVYSQRRAAVVALVLALVLFAVILFWRQRRTFWMVVPLASLLAVGYVGAFWNSTGTIGFPAQAVKTVIAPDQLSAADQSSNLYREIENFDLHATIRADPLRGQGFGQKFLRPVPLPDISVFEFNEYIPHNSFLWLWIKLGFVGFAGFLYVVARAVVAGVDRVRRQPAGVDLVVSILAVLFVVMFTVYTYVDIAWEPRNAVLLGLFLALCCSPLPNRSSSSDESQAGRLAARSVA